MGTTQYELTPLEAGSIGTPRNPSHGTGSDVDIERYETMRTYGNITSRGGDRMECQPFIIQSTKWIELNEAKVYSRRKKAGLVPSRSFLRQQL